jgi:hypothetical protein
MKYADLLAKLNTLTPKQLEHEVTVFDVDRDEIYTLHDWAIMGTGPDDECRPPDDSLEDGDFYLTYMRPY